VRKFENVFAGLAGFYAGHYPILEDRIRAAASEFRHKLDNACNEKLPIPFRDFPHGSCGVASEALGYFLRAVLGIEAEYVHVATNDFPRPGFCSHAWLEFQGIVIDITADQFGQAPVLVTLDRGWHDRFGAPNRQSLTTDTAWFRKYCEPILALFKTS
jgi:hypothetical protein